ncbi:MAG: hypothetical protein ACFE0Q_21175 [Anaerolineae bacterium]
MIQHENNKQYRLDWYVEDKILQITFYGHFSSEDAVDINQQVTHWLDQHDDNLILLIDSLALNTVTDFQNVRNKLTFVDNRRIRGIFILTRSKLIRLSLLVIFSLSPAMIKFFDSQTEAEQFASNQLSVGL